MLLRRLFAPRTPASPVPRALYEAAVIQARQPAFYRDVGVPDTLDGRFELISLHVYLILRRLRVDHEETGRLSQEVFDMMFADMDSSLREMGAGDLGVGPRVKKMARNFYGRVAAYDAGLEGEASTLEDALRRNLFGTVTVSDDAVAAMALYVRREDAVLAEISLEQLCRGQFRFGSSSALIGTENATSAGERD